MGILRGCPLGASVLATPAPGLCPGRAALGVVGMGTPVLGGTQQLYHISLHCTAGIISVLVMETVGAID